MITNRSQKFWSADGRWVTEHNTWAEIEITYFDGTDLILTKTENVLRLEVPVRYSLMMQELKSVSDITNYKAGLVFGEVHALLNVR